jgi:hypothetical protein
MKGFGRWCALGLSLLAGCGEAAPRTDTRVSWPAEVTKSAADQQFAAQAATAPADAKQLAAAAGQLAGENNPAIVRKIVYKADVDLVCDDFSAAVERLDTSTVRKTRFGLRATGQGYEFFVIEQRYL